MLNSQIVEMALKNLQREAGIFSWPVDCKRWYEHRDHHITLRGRGNLTGIRICTKCLAEELNKATEQVHVLSKEEMKEELNELEEKYNMTSGDYYLEYMAGNSDDLGLEGADALRWATLWETLNREEEDEQ